MMFLARTGFDAAADIDTVRPDLSNGFGDILGRESPGQQNGGG